jgi:hypothetical protein
MNGRNTSDVSSEIPPKLTLGGIGDACFGINSESPFPSGKGNGAWHWAKTLWGKSEIPRVSLSLREGEPGVPFRGPELGLGKETFGESARSSQVLVEKRVKRKRPRAGARGLLCIATGEGVG